MEGDAIVFDLSLLGRTGIPNREPEVGRKDSASKEATRSLGASHRQ